MADSPYEVVDTLLYTQLTGFTDLTDVVPSRRIVFEMIDESAQEFTSPIENSPTIKITPANVTPEIFQSADTSNDPMLWDIAILVPGRNYAELRQIQYQVRRALSFFQDWKGPTGSAISVANQGAPFKMGAGKITGFQFVREEDQLTCVITYRVNLTASEAEIQADT